MTIERTRRLLIWLCLTSLAACHPKPPAADAPPMSTTPEGVTLKEGAPQWEYIKLDVTQESDALAPLPVPGRIGFDPRRTTTLGTPLAGRIEEVRVRLGDRVKVGERLYSVRSQDFAEMGRDEATAREGVQVKQRLRDRAKDLYQLNAIPEKELLAADAELTEARLSLKAASAKRQSLSVTSGSDNLFWIKAPTEGTIVSLDVTAGLEVGPDRTEPLLRIASMGEVMVEADIPEIDAGDVVAGSPVSIRTRDGLIREGTVQYVASIVDPQRQTIEVRVRAANADGALRPNAFVEVTFQPPAGVQRILIPEEAVVSDGSRLAVFVQENGTLKKREVQTGRRRDHQVEIRSGLESGARYVSKGALLLLNQVDLTE